MSLACAARGCPHAPMGSYHTREAGRLELCELHHRVLADAGELVDWTEARPVVAAPIEQDRARPLRHLHAGAPPAPRPRPRPVPPPERAAVPAARATERRSPPALRVVRSPLPTPTEVPDALTVAPPAPLPAAGGAIADTDTHTPTEVPMSTPRRRAGLCAVPACKNARSHRNVCDTCWSRAKKLPDFPIGAGDLDAELLGRQWAQRIQADPSRARRRNGGRRATGTLATACRWPGCEGRVARHEMCHRHWGRLRPRQDDWARASDGQRTALLPVLIAAFEERVGGRATRAQQAARVGAEIRRAKTAEKIGAGEAKALTAQLSREIRRADVEADTPLQTLRGLLGCDPDGSDAEVVDAVRKLQRQVYEHDRHTEVLAGTLGLPELFPLEFLVEDVKTLAEKKEQLRRERDAMQVSLDLANEALDALPCSAAPDLDTPAQRIRYATSAWLAEREEAAHLAQLCQDAHTVLDEVRGAESGTPAQRIRWLVVHDIARLQAAFSRMAETLGLPFPIPVADVHAEVERLVQLQKPAALEAAHRELLSVDYALEGELLKVDRDAVEDLAPGTRAQVIRSIRERLRVPAEAPRLRVVRARLDDTGRVRVLLEQDAPEDVLLPLGNRVALVVEEGLQP